MPETKAAMPCCGNADPRFEATVVTAPMYANRLKWCAQVRVRCFWCNRHFRFVGLTPGIFGGNTPSTVSYMGYDAMLPIEPITNEMQLRAIDETDPFNADDATMGEWHTKNYADGDANA